MDRCVPQGTITDDTQMTLFTAEGLLRGWVCGCFKGITTYPGMTALAYLRWLQTQGERSRYSSKPYLAFSASTIQCNSGSLAMWLISRCQLQDLRFSGFLSAPFTASHCRLALPPS